MPRPLFRGPRALGVLICLGLSFQQITAQQAPVLNFDPTYEQLRTITLSGEAIGVSNLILKRDAATFHLRTGTLCFLAPVQGKVSGAVFDRDGNLLLEPPLNAERLSLRLLTKDSEFVETFDHMVLLQLGRNRLLHRSYLMGSVE